MEENTETLECNNYKIKENIVFLLLLVVKMEKYQSFLKPLWPKVHDITRDVIRLDIKRDMYV